VIAALDTRSAAVSIPARRFISASRSNQVTTNVGLCPTPRLAGALCAPPSCGNENRILVRSHITV
jgi:hypothetical protein